MARWSWPARRRAPAIWVGNSNGTSGRVDAQNSSLSKLLGWNWNLEESIATGTHNSEFLDHLERRLAAPAALPTAISAMRASSAIGRHREIFFGGGNLSNSSPGRNRSGSSLGTREYGLDTTLASGAGGDGTTGAG